jgi:sugar transferase (PEP-CTERM/EpsH1 system associated)
VTKPPLVAHIIYSLATGGLENGLVNILNRSPSDRYRHVIICITTAHEFAQRITAEDVQVIELHKREGHDLGFYWRLRQVLKELQPNIVHSRNLAALESQLCGLGLGNIRRVHGEHGREINDLDGSNWKYLQFRRLMRLFIHQYITVSQDLQQWLIDSVGVREDRVSHIYNGVDQACFAPLDTRPLALLPQQWQALDGMLIVGTVGRLTPVKDQQLLLRAVAQLRDDRPEFSSQLRVVIVGDGPLRADLAKLVTELKLEDLVWMAGDRDDVSALLCTLDVFVLPSLAEGVSNTVLEAMASGLPVIATAAGGNIELVEEGFNGSLFPVGDYHALAQALGGLLDDDEMRAMQGKNARDRVCQRFDWDRTVEAYLAVYDALIQPTKAVTLENTG